MRALDDVVWCSSLRGNDEAVTVGDSDIVVDGIEHASELSDFGVRCCVWCCM